MNQDKTVEVTALAALYQAERSENVTLLNINIALVGAELAYAAATVSFIDKLPTLPPLGAALVPIPLWLGMLYNVLLVALTGRRGASAMKVENQLYKYTGLRTVDRESIGSLAGEYVVNPVASSWAYKVPLVFVYAFPWALTSVYTWYILDRFTGAHRGLFHCALIGYGLLLVAAIGAAIKAAISTPKVTT